MYNTKEKKKTNENTGEERVSHVKTKIIPCPWWGHHGWPNIPKCHERKMCLKSFNIAKTQDFKAQKQNGDNFSKH